MDCNLWPGPDWVPGIIAEVLGPVTYIIEMMHLGGEPRIE